MKKKLVVLLVSSILLLIAGCTITPKPTVNSIASFDATTPRQYNDQSGGFIGFDSATGGGIITTNALSRYNLLIGMYKGKMKTSGVEIKENDGISPFKDVFGNNLFLIDKQHLVHFGVMNQMKKDRVEADGFMDKVIDKITK